MGDCHKLVTVIASCGCWSESVGTYGRCSFNQLVAADACGNGYIRGRGDLIALK